MNNELVKKSETQATPVSIKTGENKKSIVFTIEEQIHTHHIYISDYIPDSAIHLDTLNIIRTCDPNDRVIVYINNEGGSCSHGQQYINALMECPSKDVTVQVDGSIWSMGAVLFVAAIKLAHAKPKLGNSSLLMFHNYSSGLYGKGHEQKAYTDALFDYYHKTHMDQVFPFLSSDELERLRDGKDIYVYLEDAEKRINNLINFMNGRNYYDGKTLIVVEPPKTKRPYKTKKKYDDNN